MKIRERPLGRGLCLLTLLGVLGLAGLGAIPDAAGLGAGVSLAQEAPSRAGSVQPAGGPGLLGEEVTQPTGIAVDSAGNTYVTGQWVNGSGSSNFATIRYDSAGKQKWVRYYNGPAKGNDGSNGVAVDSSGNVYVTGSSENDYGSDSFATVRYDSAGKQQWAKRYSGPTRGSDRPSGIAVDSQGNAYVAGDSEISGGRFDFTTIKYDSPEISGGSSATTGRTAVPAARRASPWTAGATPILRASPSRGSRPMILPR